MKLLHIAGVVLVAPLLLALAGCQTGAVIAPPPDFDAPAVRLEKPAQLPKAPPPQQAKQTKPASQAPVAQASISPDALIGGVALKPKAPARPWKYIVIHHSDTPFGSAKRFDASHRAKGWDMLGYDFVIGNGSETPDGQVEVGPRWTKQMVGAHTGTPDNRFNEKGIGICLVGNFDENKPTAKQMDSLARLCAYLMKTYGISVKNVVGHRDCKPTQCPGRHMNLEQVRKLASGYLARMK